MTLQERYDETKAAADTLSKAYAEIRAKGVEMELELTRLDAAMKLLETLMADEKASQVT